MLKPSGKLVDQRLILTIPEEMMDKDGRKERRDAREYVCVYVNIPIKTTTKSIIHLLALERCRFSYDLSQKVFVKSCNREGYPVCI